MTFETKLPDRTSNRKKSNAVRRKTKMKFNSSKREIRGSNFFCKLDTKLLNLSVKGVKKYQRQRTNRLMLKSPPRY